MAVPHMDALIISYDDSTLKFRVDELGHRNDENQYAHELRSGELFWVLEHRRQLRATKRH